MSYRSFLVCLVLIGVLGVSCRRGAAPSVPGLARLAPGTPVLSLDPTLSEGATFSALSNVFEPLVAYDARLQITPALATHWATPDDLTWTFTLRPGVLFHDGTPFDAPAVVTALERARSSPDSTVRGALWAARKMEATGSLALRIRTSVPDALLLHELTLVLIARGGTRAEVESAPVGTGAYRVASWSRGGALDLVAWERYWAGPPAIPAIRIAPVPAGLDPVEAVARGEADVAEIPAITARRDPPRGVRFFSSPGLTTHYLWMNGPARPAGEENPFFDVRVRAAVALAVDRPRLALEATGTEATAALQLVPPTIVGYAETLPAARFDPDAARALLEGAGYRLPIAATLAHRSDPESAAVARLLQEMLDTAGFRVTLRPMPWSEFLAETREGRIGLFLGGWAFDTADAGGLLRDCVRSRFEGGATGVFNPGFVNPQIDRLVDASHSVFISTSRLALLEEAIRITTNEAPLVPLYHQPDTWAVSPRLDWKPRLDGRLIASEMRFVARAP